MSEESWLAKKTVQGVLTDTSLQKITPFSIGGVGFDIRTFPILSDFIERGQIKVEYDSDKDGMAEYDYGTNKLLLGYTWFLDYPKGALIAHECTHAVYDVAKKSMSVAISESIAYIVQCMYILIKRGDSNKRLTSTNSAKDLVFERAWKIGADLLNGKTPTQLEQQNLQTAVSLHPFYKKNSAGNAGYNGV